MALQWSDLKKEGALFDNQLPPIIPIVFYHGAKNWQIPTSFQDLVHNPGSEFKSFIPNFNFSFFDVMRADSSRLANSLSLSFYVEMLKVLHSTDLKELLPRLVEGLTKAHDSQTALEYLEIFFNYIVRSTDTVGREDIMRALKQLPASQGELIMNTLAQEWLQEGRVEGAMTHGQEMLISFAKERFDILSQDAIGKIKMITSQEVLDNLTKKAWRSESLEELETWIIRLTAGINH